MIPYRRVPISNCAHRNARAFSGDDCARVVRMCGRSNHLPAFYREILGFRLQWKGGPTDTKFEWISYMAPDGYDWIEYMVRDTQPTPQQLRVVHHYALGTLDIRQVYKTVVERGYKPPREPNIARDGRWLLQLYDKNFTRTEMMIRKPVQTPCCSPKPDDYK